MQDSAQVSTDLMSGSQSPMRTVAVIDFSSFEGYAGPNVTFSTRRDVARGLRDRMVPIMQVQR
jgi:hypothetical protein